MNLQVIADDLTGACDVAAALLPWPGGVSVYPDGQAPPATGGLAVRNTQSRTLPAAVAAARVRQVLESLARCGTDVLLKKIDTGLRGPLGAEIDAVLDALVAPRAFVLPAIPEVGRTTVGGEQRIDGVPVHRTPFAHDPHNPVLDARVAAVIAATARRTADSVYLDSVRRPGGLRRALDACTAPIVVIDAETDADLARGVTAVLERERPLVLVGSIGLARAVRAAEALRAGPPGGAVAGGGGAGGDVGDIAGILVVIGSAHPVARAQRDDAQRRGAIDTVIEVPPAGGAAAGRQAARLVAAGRTVALAAPEAVAIGGEAGVGADLREAVLEVLAGARPAGLLLVGGETAYHVLGGLGHPPLTVDGRPAPLAVRGRIAAGPHAGLALVTKGGSSGDPGLLAALVRAVRPGGA